MVIQMMRTKKGLIYFIGIAIALLCMLYGTLWIYVMYHFNNAMSQYAGQQHQLLQIFDNTNYSLMFSKSSLDGFPFKFGLKLHDVVEDDIDGRIIHKSPLYIGYDIKKQVFYVSYDGESIAQAKPLESGFGTEIDGKYSYQFHFPLTFDCIKLLLSAKTESDSNIILINMIKSATFNIERIKVHDIIDKNLLFSGQILFSLDIPNMKQYKSIDDLMINIPKHYHIISNARIDNSVGYGKRLSPLSLIYGPLSTHFVTHQLDLDITTTAKTANIADIIGNVEIRTNKWTYSDSAESVNNTTYYKSDSNIKDGDISLKLQHQSTSHPTEHFFDQTIDKLKDIGTAMLQAKPNIESLQYVLVPFLKDPKHYTPRNINSPKKIDAIISFDLHGKDSKIDFNINNMSITADNIGIQLHNSTQIDSMFKWKTKGMLSLINYSNMIDGITNYINDVRDDKKSQDVIKMNQVVYKQLIKLLSEHPDSSSNNVFIDYEFGTDHLMGKIGKYTLPQLKILYYITLYNQAVNIATNSSDFNKTLYDLIPEILNDKVLLEEIKKEIAEINKQKTK